MKKLSFLFCISMLSILFSCSNEIENELIEKDLQMSKSIDEAKSGAIIRPDGTVQHSGYGYDILGGRELESPFLEGESFEVTSLPTSSYSYEFTENNSDLTKLSGKNISIESSGTISFLDVSSSIKAQIEDKLTINQKHINVIVQFKVYSTKWLTKGLPKLKPEAQSLIDNKKYSDFIKRYGTMYVDSEIAGAQLLYYFTYDYSKTDKFSKFDFAAKAKASISKIFNGSSNISLTSEEQRIIESTRVDEGVLSDVKLFKFSPITSMKPDQELSKLIDHLNSNPSVALPLDLKFKSYTSIFKSSEIQNEFQNHVECYQKLKKWEAVLDNIKFIRNSTNDTSLKNRCNQAITSINTEINKSKACNGASFPQAGIYNDIYQAWNIELRLVKLYRYYHSSVKNHFYTTNYKELGGGKLGYRYEGVAGKVLKSRYNGSVPLYRYYNSRVKDHFYTTNYNELGGGRLGFRYEGIAGYIYRSRKTNTVPLYRYYNSRVKNHFYTTNYNELGGGRHGYRYEGVAGYVYR